MAIDRINSTFERLKKEGKSAMVAYHMAGDPDPFSSIDITRYLASLDADVIELGLPFSDPLADGPVIQKAGQRALEHNFNINDFIKMVSTLRAEIQVPLVCMTYINPIMAYGIGKFCRDSAEAGLDGMIVPDLPMEEADDLETSCKKEGLALIYLIAPTTPPERVKKLGKKGNGFLYYVSRTGTTGEKAKLADELREKVNMVKSNISLPLVVGFGISTPEQAKIISEIADGVVIGSAIVSRIGAAGSTGEAEEELKKFLSPIISVLHNSSKSDSQ